MKLTPRTAAAVADYAELIGLEPEEFINRFLEDFLLGPFADPQTGNAEPFLLSFTFKDAGRAERLAAWIQGGHLTVPELGDILEVEVFEQPAGGFKVKAAWIGDGPDVRNPLLNPGHTSRNTAAIA